MTPCFLEFVPQSFVLPDEFDGFCTAFQQRNNSVSLSSSANYWILKPSDRARGLGITVIHSVDQVPVSLRSIRCNSNAESNSPVQRTTPHVGHCSWSDSSFVVSKYISNPLLINGKKFDLRIYVLVKQFQPLNAYVYTKGFARFCTELYTNDVSQLGNSKVHLTNLAIQQTSTGGERYKNSEEVKWSLDKVFKYILESATCKERAEQLWNDIKSVVRHTLLSVQDVVVSDAHSFELFGFDILVDDCLSLHLMEVNGSPSLSPSDEADFHMKIQLIDDVLSIVIPDSFNGPGKEHSNFLPL